MPVTTNLSSPRWKVAARIIDRFIVWSPWIWLSVFTTFVLLVTLQFGTLPTYGQPDPKFAGPVSMLYVPTMVLMFVTLAAVPIGVPLAIHRLWKSLTKTELLRSAIFYLVGLGIFLSVTACDVAGLMVWLAD